MTNEELDWGNRPRPSGARRTAQEDRLRRAPLPGNSLGAFGTGQPSPHAEAAKVVAEAINPLDDWAELQTMRAELERLEDLLE